MKLTLTLVMLSALCLLHPALADPATELFNAVNAYRAQNGLPPVPYNPQLASVAAAHVNDQNRNMSPLGGRQCNLHSWSDCCYTPSHSNLGCMQNKPSQLAGYPGRGYEVSASNGAGYNGRASSAASQWASSAGHRAMVLNQGEWNQPWTGMGCAVSGAFANCWFGNS